MTVPTPYKAKIVDTGETILVEEGTTLLDAALTAGLEYPHRCRKGRCGTCKSHLLAGAVTLLQHTKYALSEIERADGLILACRAQLLSDIEIKWATREIEVSSPPYASERNR